MQMKALVTLIERERIVDVDRTGGGKTHVIRLTGTLLHGVHLIFHPILALTADQLTHFQSGSDDYGSIVAINLDEMFTTAAWKKKIIEYMTTLTKDTTTTVFIFASPQLIADNTTLRSALLNNCARKGTLRSITIDEAHLWAKHGSSFREEIRFLQHEFFAPLYAGNDGGPLFLAMTATMSKPTLATFMSLTSVGFPLANRVWADAVAFAQPNIAMSHVVSSEYTKNLNSVVEHCRDNPTGGAFVFVNMKTLSHKLLPLLEAKLADSRVAVDVIHIHGSLDKDEKLSLVKLLMGSMTVSDFNPNAMIATSAADVGMNHPNVGLVLIFEWPEDVATYVQRRGRGGRQGQRARTILVAGLSAHVSLVSRIFRQGDSPDDDADTDVNATIEGQNTIVTPRKKKKRAHGRKKSYPLSSGQRKNLVVRGLDEHLDVLILHCHRRGCQHVLIQEYLASGRLPRLANPDIPTCGGSCGVCSPSWLATFFPVYKDAVLLWFNSGTVRDAFPMNATVENLFRLLWKVQHWTTSIFDRGFTKVQRSNVEGFFLQLIAAGFIAVKRVGGDLKWVLCHESTSRYYDRLIYENDDNWHGMCLHPFSPT
jgi:superfamily II DNA helicase RecQ